MFGDSGLGEGSQQGVLLFRLGPIASLAVFGSENRQRARNGFTNLKSERPSEKESMRAASKLLAP